MTERDVHALRAEALATLAEATRAANDVPDVESALGHLTAATQGVLGNKALLPTSPRASHFSMAYSHPYEENPMTWRAP